MQRHRSVNTGNTWRADEDDRERERVLHTFLTVLGLIHSLSFYQIQSHDSMLGYLMDASAICNMGVTCNNIIMVFRSGVLRTDISFLFLSYCLRGVTCI